MKSIRLPSCCLIVTFALFLIRASSSLDGAELGKNAEENEGREYALKLKEYELAKLSQQREYELKLTEHKLAERAYRLNLRGHWLTIIGLLGSGLALGFGYRQYRKADDWKRAEFLAKEMKEFFDDRDVKNVLTMIDWSPRRINLLHVEDKNSDNYPKVTRELQVSALRPHTLIVPIRGFDAATSEHAESSGKEFSLSGERSCHFSQEEALIRDHYDRFLDHLERFSSYMQSGLISKKDLDPYLGYWIDDIAFTTNTSDAAWTCTLMAYIEFYCFDKVRQLFRKYGFDISTSGNLFRE